MEYAVPALAALALILALAALAKAGAAARRADEAARASGAASPGARRGENEALVEELATQRRLLAALAAGAKLTPEMVNEGRVWRDVDAAAGARLFAAGELHVIDVRTPQEAAAGILPGARLIPIDELPQRLREIPKDGRPKLIYCAGGARSAAACELLEQHGHVELYNLECGFAGWSGPRVRPAG